MYYYLRLRGMMRQYECRCEETVLSDDEAPMGEGQEGGEEQRWPNLCLTQASPASPGEFKKRLKATAPGTQPEEKSKPPVQAPPGRAEATSPEEAASQKSHRPNRSSQRRSSGHCGCGGLFIW